MFTIHVVGGSDVATHLYNYIAMCALMRLIPIHITHFRCVAITNLFLFFLSVCRNRSMALCRNRHFFSLVVSQSLIGVVSQSVICFVVSQSLFGVVSQSLFCLSLVVSQSLVGIVSQSFFVSQSLFGFVSQFFSRCVAITLRRCVAIFFVVSQSLFGVVHSVALCRNRFSLFVVSQSLFGVVSQSVFLSSLCLNHSLAL